MYEIRAISDRGQVNISDSPDRPTYSELEEIANQLSSQLGGEWNVTFYNWG